MLQRCQNSTGLVWYASPLLQRAAVPHGFSTRIGGVSTGPFATLNLGNPQGDQQDSTHNIHANTRRFLAAIGAPPDSPQWVHQVHGPAVLDSDAPGFSCGSHADALLTHNPASTLLIRTADCVPILLASKDGRHVAAVHAGWRGVIAGVVTAAVHALTAKISGGAATCLAAIGPCISADHFEVGPEVIDAFRNAFPDPADCGLTSEAPTRVDLRRAVQSQLLHAGIPSSHIDLTDRCTVRDRDEFFSHRRERGLTGRMLAAISPTAAHV